LVERGFGLIRKVQPYCALGDFQGISFSDLNNGIAVGWDGVILRTTDGGNTWIQENSNTMMNLYGVSTSTADVATVVGQSGAILRSRQ